jgi:hypothetical protein
LVRAAKFEPSSFVVRKCVCAPVVPHTQLTTDDGPAYDAGTKTYTENLSAMRIFFRKRPCCKVGIKILKEMISDRLYLRTKVETRLTRTLIREVYGQDMTAVLEALSKPVNKLRQM